MAAKAGARSSAGSAKSAPSPGYRIDRRFVMAPCQVHIVGSMPFANAAEGFERLSESLGSKLQRLPDGETGFRRGWSGWQDKIFAADPQFRKTGKLHAMPDKPGDPGVAKYTLVPGLGAEDVRFHLPHADYAIADYREFARLKAAGKVPPHCRFQFDLAPGHVVVWRWFVEELHEVLEPAYDRALIAEIEKMLSVIPATELSLQWDIASRVFARLEWGQPTRYGADKSAMAETFARNLVALGEGVPEPVELMYHFCYGYTGEKHTVEPSDMGDMVMMANKVDERIRRPINLIHMPVPRDRQDDAYFAPLQGLRLRPGTEIALGLVHHTDGVAGGRARMASARKYLPTFRIATECGWGQRPIATIPELLQLHAELSQ
jgi:hypothetical protein